MRIGIHAAYLGRSFKTGIEVYAEEVIGRLSKLGNHEYFLVGTTSELSGISGENVTYIPITSQGKLLPLVREIASIVQKYSLDVFFFPTQYTFFQRNQNTVSTAFDVAWKYFPDYFPLSKRIAFDALTRYMVKKASSILSISDSTKEDLVSLYNCDPLKVTTVHLGYNQQQYIPDRQKEIDDTILKSFGLEENGYHLFLGTLQKRKNIINLLKSYDIAKTGKPLVLAGGKGWYYDEIKSVLDKMNRKNLVFELGYVKEFEKPSLYRGCSSFLYPSLYEGFGLPVLEAMACGCKVVTSNVSSLPEITGDAGICVDPYNLDEIADAIDNCEKKETDVLVSKAIARARKFSWDRTATQTLSIIEDSINK